MANSHSDRSAVVDIGSNSVRMVMFDRGDRSLEPVFNEKAMCGLGKGLLETGRLNAEGRDSAIAILSRFRRVAADLGAGQLQAVATAAARAADDGAAFIVEAQAALGHDVNIISGEEEARLSALGVICGVPEADGLIGDLGGGSLEVAEVKSGVVSQAMSLQVGPLSLGDLIGKRGEGRKVAGMLEAVADGAAEGRALYVVGGAWRALARYQFERTKHPIRIINGFEMDSDAARELGQRVGRIRPDGLNALKGISGRRRPTAPYAGRLLARLIDRLRPDRVVFSGYGLREGLEYDRMSTRARRRDPLIDHCRRVGQAGARMPFDGVRMAEWAMGAFMTPPAAASLVTSAAWLSDMSGSDHPDYRGHHAAARALHLPAAGISHPDRVFLAAAVYARYHGFGMENALGAATELLDERERRLATALGMAFRLAHAIEPGDGAAGLRRHFSLKRDGKTLMLQAEEVDLELLGETARRRFASLARALEVEPAIVRLQSAAA